MKNYNVAYGVHNPCKDCGRRSAECHAHCEDYQKYCSDMAERKEKNRLAFEMADYDSLHMSRLRRKKAMFLREHKRRSY